MPAAWLQQASGAPGSGAHAALLPRAMVHSCALVVAVAAVVIVHNSMRNVEPYMDEIYHVPQAQRFCANKWGRDDWDGKITTFPGIYIVAYAFTNALNIVSPTGCAGGDTCIQPCSVQALRAMNVAFGCLTLLLLLYIVRSLRVRGISPTMKEMNVTPSPIYHIPYTMYQISRNNTTEISYLLFLYPASYLYYFMYYTDAASLFMTLCAYGASQHLREAHSKSSSGSSASLFARQFAAHAINCAAILMRQTNAIWVLFFGATLALQELARMDAGVTEGQLTITPHLLRKVLREVSDTSNFKRLVYVCWPYILPVGCAVIVFAYNGSVTLGDKENHRFFLHLAMPLHMIFIFSLLDGWLLRSALRRLLGVGSSAGEAPPTPFFVAGRSWREWLQSQRPALPGRRSLLAHCCGLLSVCSALGFFSLGHIFVLSDNRHYTYYLWKRMLSSRPLRMCLGFVYYPCAYTFFKRMEAKKGTLWTAGFAAAAGLTLIPSPLLELRYFTPAVALALLVMGGGDEDASRGAKFIDCAVLWYNVFLCGLANATVLFIYLYRLLPT